MRALATIHNSLRPYGLLLDVRPASQHPQLVIQHLQHLQHLQHGDQNSPATAYQDGRGGEGAAEQVARVVQIGQIDDSYRIGTQAIADAAMQTVIDAGTLRAGARGNLYRYLPQREHGDLARLHG